MPVKKEKYRQKKEKIQELETENKNLNVKIKNFLIERDKLYQRLKGEIQDLENKLLTYGNLPQRLQVAERRIQGLRWMLSQINQQKEEIKDRLENQLLLVSGADERWKEEIKKLNAEKKEVETWLDNSRERYIAVNKRLDSEKEKKVQLEILKHNQILELQEEIWQKEFIIQKLDNPPWLDQEQFWKEDLQFQYRTLQKIRSQLERDNTDLIATVNGCYQVIAELRDQNTNQNVLINRFRQRKSELKKQTTDLEKEKDSLIEEKNELRDELSEELRKNYQFQRSARYRNPQWRDSEATLFGEEAEASTSQTTKNNQSVNNNHSKNWKIRFISRSSLLAFLAGNLASGYGGYNLGKNANDLIQPNYLNNNNLPVNITSKDKNSKQFHTANFTPTCPNLISGSPEHFLQKFYQSIINSNQTSPFVTGDVDNYSNDSQQITGELEQKTNLTIQEQDTKTLITEPQEIKVNGKENGV
ncbi:MAG: hypothetical protein I3273_07740 [Candidatus Moeniiplasma glomeromycotorum]|nr:hypothetical protein [Candidatus Moeniiplasma glomeromycotorum]MCE8169972.1 hypothetical protein [Candidatus Moeniiplasma glomeromycotorum]